MHKLYIISCSFWIVTLFATEAQAQTGKKLSVKESVKMALEHSYGLQAAEADAAGARAAFRKSRSNRFPSVSGRASYMRLSDNIPAVDFSPPGSDTTLTILPVELDQFRSELGIEQLLFAGGRLNSRVEAAGHQAEAAGLMEKEEQVQVAFQAREAYWKLFQAEAEHKVVRSALKRVNEHLKNVRNKLEAGTALRTDLLNAKTRRSEVLLDQVESRSRVQVARLELNRLLGLPAGAKTEPVAPDQPGVLSFEMEKLAERALQQRPGLQALSERIGAREAQVDAVQAEWFPEISLVGRYVYARPNQYFFAQQDQFKGTWEAGLQLQWNLWSGGQRSAQTSQARAQLRKAEARLAEKKEQARIEVTRRYLELKRAIESIDVAAKSVEAAEEAYKSAQRQYKAGAVLSEQVLDAQHAYRKTQARHARAVASYQIAYAGVLNAMGQIWRK